MSQSNLAVIILAAGQGSRMKSKTPKVLHTLAGKPLLQHSINVAHNLNADSIHVVYGHRGEEVRAAFPDSQVNWVEQTELLGTGHAVMQVLPHLNDSDYALTLVGDIPLISANTLDALVKKTLSAQGVGIVTAEVANPTGLGRILRTNDGEMIGVVEHKDATKAQRGINEINSGIIMAPVKQLKQWLPNIDNDNQQGEYYLPDIFKHARGTCPIVTVKAHNETEVLGINDRKQLAELERCYQLQRADEFMLSGVRLMDPARFDLRGDAEIGQDTVIDVNVILQGKVKIGKNCRVGANCILTNTTIADNVTIEAGSIVEDAIVATGCTVGPFARLRPGTVLEKNAKVGNFVETKKTTLGEGSKANHLTYLGDADIGKGVNIGAGTITCNYDGVNKSVTTIEDNVFIGSNSSLIAPVTIGKGATIGASSAISKDAPAEQLTVARGKQVTIASWKKPNKK